MKVKLASGGGLNVGVFTIIAWIAIRITMMAITTKSSINVKPFRLLMAVLLLPKKALSNRHLSL
jgi:hypothetical protein